MLDDKQIVEIEERVKLRDGWTTGDAKAMVALLADRRELVERVKNLEADLDRLENYVEHADDCTVSFFDAYDPERGWQYRGGWTKELPKCTCGLNDPPWNYRKAESC